MTLVNSEAIMEGERRPFSLGTIILLKEKGGMRESFPRQVDRELFYHPHSIQTHAPSEHTKLSLILTTLLM